MAQRKGLILKAEKTYKRENCATLDKIHGRYRKAFVGTHLLAFPEDGSPSTPV